MTENKPRGILRNKSVTETTESIGETLDRQQVIRNTQLNSQLASESSTGDKIRAKIAEEKAKHHDGDGKLYPEHLHWDELNLYRTEQEKSATMRIDEPKTPYDVGFDPSGEYYRDDDDEEIPDFTLGEGEYEQKEGKGMDSLNGGRIVKDSHQQDDEEEDDEGEDREQGQAVEETAEERHRRFEEMRKSHYHMKGNALRQKIEISDDEEE